MRTLAERLTQFGLSILGALVAVSVILIVLVWPGSRN